MAATTTATQFFQNSSNNNNKELNRDEIQTAIAKAVELRALHAALKEGNSLPKVRFPPPSPALLPAALPPAAQLSAQDYPIFTPSYEDDPLPAYHQLPVKGRTLSESWDEHRIETGLIDYKKGNLSSRKGLPSGLVSLESHICPVEDNKSTTDVSLQIITSESENRRSIKNSNLVMPLPDSHSSVQSQPKSKGVISWLFPRLKKKHKNENSPNRIESEDVSQILDLGILSIETLKKELIEANENKDAALMEVAEIKSSLGELKQKMEYLETYCEELKKALRKAMQTKDSHLPEKLNNLPKRGKPFDGNGGENLKSVSEDAMVEGFLQIVSEARLSVKQFCKTLIGQSEETDSSLMDNLNLLLQPYKLSVNSKYSKAVLHHLEALINQLLYQDFENCVFQKNGSPKLLDPRQDRQTQFSSFVALRNLSWNEVLRKGTKYYSEEFSKFCDQKMSCIITTLNWTRPWPEQLLQAFFVAAKCIWLLHLLAFSFNPPLGILRVEENRSFDPHYMEDMFMERQKPHGPSCVKIMVMPGFYVQDKVLRCKVLCRYKPAS
ncbi:IRK-interacting protein [Quillaja saponaria]|uniref:IRK-interacting protein n=1 Tax=Quillaja saponaria TaxID=32244 RepID=A0AAD7KX63_QUISA|nr:IRK-interacting protein [Quillaja saponaria]